MINPTVSELKLLSLLSRINCSPIENKEIQKLIGKVSDWDNFYELAHLNRYAPFVYKNLVSMGLEHHISEVATEKFIENAKRIERVNKARLKEAQKFLKLFSERGIEVVILKGIYYGETFYNDPYYKRMNDVDILIHKKDLDKIFEVFEELGFFSAGELLGKSAREHDEFSHHLPPFFSRSLNLMVGTHWELHTPMRSYRLDYETLWSRVVEFDFYGNTVKALGDIDNLHHLCVHLSFFKAGAREVGDICNLVRAFRSQIDWSLFLEEVDKAKSHNPVYLALSLAHIQDPMSEFSYALEYLRPNVSKKTIKKVAEKQKSLKIFYTTRSAHITRVDKAFTSFKSTKKASEKLKFYLQMWKHLILPPNEDVVRLCNIENPTTLNILIGKVRAPIRIMSSLADDVGTKIFFLLLAYTFVKVIWVQIKAPFTGKVQDQKDFAKKLGVTVEDLKKLQDRLE